MFRRLLKNVTSEAKTKQKLEKNRHLHSANEDFVPIFTVIFAIVAILQLPVRRFVVAAVVFGTLSMHTGASETQPAVPVYNFEECCAICPQTENPASYENGFLKEFKFLKEANNGWLFRTEIDWKTQFGPSPERYAELKRFNDTLKAKGVQLVLVYVPTRGLMHGDKLTEAQKNNFPLQQAREQYKNTLMRLRTTGTIVPDLSLMFAKEHDNFFFKRDHHWTSYGARLTAEIVAEEIKKQRVYASIPRMEFQTQVSGVLRRIGTHQTAYKKICAYDIGDQVIDAFTTESSGAEADLFGESKTDVTLVGTSNSKGAMEYNFAGFLKQNMSIDIDNVAMAGARYDGALIQYLPTEDFQKNPPKILIWEVPGQYSLDNELFYRQVIPLITNGCTSKNVLIEKSTQLTQSLSGENTPTEILFNGGGKLLKLNGNNHVIDLQFSDPTVKEIEATVWYINGRKELIRTKVANRVNNKGRFVFELKRDGEWKNMNFLSLDLARLTSYSKDLKVKATLCEAE